MLFGVFNRTGQTDSLREQLDVSAQRTRAIASRVARASMASDGRGGFSLMTPEEAAANGAAGGDGQDVDIESEMASLADEQLRYDATAKLLERSYQQFRASLRDH